MALAAIAVNAMCPWSPLNFQNSFNETKNRDNRTVMKIITYGPCLFSFMLAAVFITSPPVMAGQGSVLEKINAANEPFDNMKIESAHQLTLKTVVAKESYQGGEFRVLARKNQISRFRCSVCHTKKPMLARDGVFFTHSDIRIKHGQGDNALTCIVIFLC